MKNKKNVDKTVKNRKNKVLNKQYDIFFIGILENSKYFTSISTNNAQIYKQVISSMFSKKRR